MIQVQKNESFEDIHGFQEDAAKNSWNHLMQSISR